MNLLPGERIRMAREEMGLTRPQLEKLTGIKPSRIATLELGDKTPTIEEAKELSSALRSVSASFLLGLEKTRTTAVNPAEIPRLPTPSSTVTTEDIVDQLVVNCRLNKEEATDFLSTWFDDLRKKVTEGEAVRLSGFGTMTLVTDKKGVKNVRFNPSPTLEARVQKVIG